jgi:hypothetical protein
LLLLAGSVNAQDHFISIAGKLVDAKTKEPLPYASVYIHKKSIGTTTNDEGRFQFHVPSAFSGDTLVVSVIGYSRFKSVVGSMVERETVIELRQSVTQLNEVTVASTAMTLKGNEIVKKAVARIPDNYPMQPFVVEGFFRDLQFENGKPVELLEAALRFRYKDYNPGFEQVEIVEIRRSFNHRHPVNGTYDRQNAIIDLMEDNYVKHRFGPMKPKGWKFAVDSVLVYDGRAVYKVSGSKGPGHSVNMYIDGDSYAILKLDLAMRMVDGKFYRRYLNLPDPYGLQETSFGVAFEFQEIDGKMYLKYQREEDTYNLFIKATNEIVLKQSFVKELFVNNVLKEAVDTVGQKMNINRSLEGQAAPFNAGFWKYYNVPVETSTDSKIVRELQESELRPDK